ncbi:hypothetical protein [Streptomyces sp. NL15-2K]|uniref:hypothetical protein n=1 Tax=Streptomyces sp. NL15-2K TaxID=376149 RepID=UPI000F577F29|nr:MULTISPECIES: hypothetical protein [Actinomycetes]WKX11100.1 hypothetical protein Q4V64_27745 [Kutzneria buriramensis]GCB47478.1 hypothetical protein SNL152K_4783 [Streptomyces sp. NL15-2K]
MQKTKSSSAAQHVHGQRRLQLGRYNDPDPAAYAKKLFKEFPQWPVPEQGRYAITSVVGPARGLLTLVPATVKH